MNIFNLKHPLAIAMWDFSWLERRWPGAGYEDWDRALDELCERGYDAVRIDAYPHLIAADAGREWEVLPAWNQNDWGSPARVRVRVVPELLEFLGKCADRKLKVGLSTWFQDDTTHRRLIIASPRAHAEIWIKTLAHIESAGLLDTIFYVDLCNEWPSRSWAPFFPAPPPGVMTDWRTPESIDWMKESLMQLRKSHPGIPATFSFNMHVIPAETAQIDVSFLDFLEPHRWMASSTDFYRRIGYHYEKFEDIGYKNVVAHAEALYRSDPEYWMAAFTPQIDGMAEWSRNTKKPLVTTEGWSIVDYKDWPGLDWGWVKELNVWAVERAAATGCWAALCTSNFCGPQFRGMWRDAAWHQRLTKLVHDSPLP